jgi:hypothetical protein
LVRRAFGVEEELIDFDCIKWDEEIIPHGWSTVSYPGGQAIGTYIKSGKSGIAKLKADRGQVISFGFQYGYAYSRRTMPIVPSNYGRREMHPVVLLKKTPIAALVGASPGAPILPIKGVEFGRFGNQFIVVNHRSSPVDISGVQARKAIPQVPSAPGWLAAHSATYLET